MRLAASRGFSLELSAREQPTAERLARGEGCLLRLKLTGDVDQCAGRRSRRHPLAPDTLDDLVVGASVQDDAGGAAQPSVPAGNEQVDLVRNVVAQLEERERALVGDECLLRADGQPLLPDLVVLGAGKAGDAVEAPSQALEAALPDVVAEQLAADRTLACLRAVK